MMASNGKYSCDGVPTTCSCRVKLHKVLQQYFGYSTFRPGQMEASLSVLHGQDVFVRMATGSGKSLCMFLGPLAKSIKAIGVVISPLNGLMEQQVKLLRNAGIPAIQIVSGSSKYKEVSAGDYRFVFMSPEVGVRCPWRNIFQTPFFKAHLALVAVDEAHCIPEWGADFRVSFKSIGGLRALADVPFMALSASAPPSIAREIQESLNMKSPVHISHSLDRPNIFLSYSKSKGLSRDLAGLADALKVAEHVPKTIIFCRTKNDCSKVYCFLAKSASNKHGVSMYHSSLTQATKGAVYDSFKSGAQLRCLSATVAFGMGMDIPDVELVVVYGLPDTMSQLYQLCGRAGRVGCQSRAHLLVTTDTAKIRDATLKSFCTDKENCLRMAMVKAIGGSAPRNPLCCMVCCGMVSNPTAFLDGGRLDVLQVGKTVRKKRRVAVRRVTEAETDTIKLKLELEREKYIQEHPTLGILGAQLVCPDSIIKTVCGNARFISVIGDMDSLCLRQELKERFFIVIITVVNS